MKGWLNKYDISKEYQDGGEIRNPKTGEVIPLTGEGRPMLSSDDRNVFQRVGDRIYNEYEEHKPQLFKDFPITDVAEPLISYLTGHSDPNIGLMNILPTAKVDDLISLYRVQPKSFNPLSTIQRIKQKVDEGKELNWIESNIWNDPKLREKYTSRGQFHGAWFEKDPKRLDYYLDDKFDESPEILEVKLPRGEVEKYSVKNIPDARRTSLSYDTEFIIPEDVRKTAKVYPASEWKNIKDRPITFQDGGKIENQFDIARRDVTNISPLEPPAVSETYNIPDYDRDAYFSLSAADKRNALKEKLSGIAFYDPFVSTVNPRDKSRVITFGEDKPELKYLRNAKFTQKAKEDVAKFAAKRNIDPNVLLSSMAIESPVLNASKYFNTHNLGMKMLERAGFPTKFKLSKDSMELPLEDLAMNAGAYMEDKSINYKKLDEKIEKWLPIANSIDSTLRTIESPMDAHALFLSEFGIDSVNPKQQVLPGVKESYSTMVKRGADYIRSRKIFEDGGNVQMKNQLVNLDQLTNFTNFNKKMKTGGWLDKYE